MSDLSWSTALWSFLAGLALFLFGNAIAVLVVLHMPTTYLVDLPSARLSTSRHPALRYVIIVFKNFLGAVIIAAGIFLALPGVPGPGLVTIAVGLMLLDFPGKHRLERRFVSHPSVLSGINRLRKRFGRPPLISHDTAERQQEAGEDEK